MFVRLIDFAIPSDWRIVIRVARGGQNLTHELIVRLVLVEARPNPFVEAVGRSGLIVGSLLVAKDQVPLVREVVGISGRIDKLVDDVRSLGGIGAGEELGGFGFGGECAGQIDEDSAKKRAIVAEW